MPDWAKDRPPLVIITWDDAWGKVEETVTVDTVDQLHKPLPIKTTGYLLKEDDEGVSIANEFYAEESTYRGYSFIPRLMIKSVTHFKLSKPRKPRSKTALESVHPGT